MLTILFDGIAYGMLLFILAVGLAVTMGLMNFINLAHGAFAMVGGYITVLLMQKAGVPFLVCLPLAFLGAALLGGILERTLYRPLYNKPHLDQVLFSGRYSVRSRMPPSSAAPRKASGRHTRNGTPAFCISSTVM